ncbi:hypothetical protein FKM82_023871 [Ascaphus truei]
MAGNKICHKPDLFTVAVLLSVTVLCITGIAFITVGASYIHECALERHIPIYVLVQGIHLLLVGIMLVLIFSRDNVFLFFIIFGTLTTFWFCWLITGSIWVFKHYTSYQGQCHRVLYLFAFWTLVIQYIGLGIMFLASIIYCCFICVMLWACGAVSG